MIRRVAACFVSAALAAALLAAPVSAQTPPAPGDQGATPAPPKQLDAKGKELGVKVDALSQQAAAVMAEYRKAFEARVDKFAEDNPTLARLKKAGVFSVDALLAGVPSDPLSGLPEIRREYENLDTTADRYVKQFGGVARSRAEAAAVEYMRKIMDAQETWREDDKDANGILDYARTFYELGQMRLLHVPASLQPNQEKMIVEGYQFQIVSADLLHWAVIASPASNDRNAGEYFLYGDESKVVRAEKGKPATRQSPPYEAPKDDKKP